MTTEPDPSLALQLSGIRHARLGDFTTAIELLQQATAQWPDDARAHHNLATALAMTEQDDAAMQSLERSLELDPANPAALYAQASLLLRGRRMLAALNALDAALELRPNDPDTLQLRGETLHKLSLVGMGSRADALASLEAALEHGGDESSLRYSMAALGGVPAPAATPRHTVVELFDQYASTFDEQLVSALKYRGPQLIVEALRAVGTPSGGDVLDLGCGTGLCGEPLRPMARTLAGVDLSPKMLEKARERGCYDTLACADVVEHLQQLSGAVDLAVAGEVLVYIGDIAPLAAALQRALRPGGRFAFSVEAMPEGSTADYAVLDSRRYGQSQAYLRRMATEHGFTVEHDEAVVLREDVGAKVAGRLQVWRKGTDA